ncbi:MAG: fibronectin type III domain-containing protein [Ferruginibacter sp.]
MKSKLLSLFISFLVLIIPSKLFSQATCTAPTNLSATVIATSGATFTWATVTGAVGYTVQYRPVTNPESAWINLTTQSTSTGVTNLVCGTVYQWHVATYCGTTANPPSPYSDIHDFTTPSCTIPCVVPVGLTTTNITATGVIFSWTAPAGAVAYIVQYRPITNPESAWINLTATSTSITVTNLVCGTNYQWHIASYCGNSTNAPSPYSDIHDFTTTACTPICEHPAAPITTNISATGATLTWTAPTGALAFIVQYRPLTPAGSPWINVTTQTNTVTLTNLTCGTAYQWQVETVCSTAAGGTSQYTAPLTFTTLPCTVPCVAPTGLTTTNITATGVTFSWTAATGAAAYIVQYRPITTPESAWINLTATSTSITATNLICGTHYQWHVATYCANTGTTAPSPYSDIHDFTTTACTTTCEHPSGLITTNITTTGATFSWTAATGAIGYAIQYRPVTTPESAWINLATQSTSFTVTNLVCGTHYQWHVATYCGSTANPPSLYSAIIDFTTAPCTTPCVAPTGLTTTNITATGITFSWTAATGAAAYIVQYRPITTPESAWINLTATSTSVTITNLVCGTHYQWHVASYCGNNTTAPGPYSDLHDFTTTACTTVCEHPSGLTTTNVGMTAAILSWTNIPGAVGYIVQYHAITTPASAWINVTSQSNVVTIPNLTCGTTYEWHVATVCGTSATNISPYSDIIHFTTEVCTPACVAPSGLTTTNVGTTVATFSWITAAGAASYVFQYRPITNPESAWITLNATSTSITVTNLVCGTHYQWHVATHCANSGATAISPYSAIIDFTTTACTTTCEHPSGLTTTNVGMTTAILSWTSIPGAVGYIVQYHAITTPASAWINVTSQSNVVTIPNLTCGTTYEWHVATVCGTSATNISPYSDIIHFTTEVCTPACVAPSGLTTTNVGTTVATFSWITAAGAASYVFQYRPITNPESAWITLNATSTSITVTNLVCGTHYQWHVATHCANSGATAISPYSAIIDFTTTACTTTCEHPSELTTTNIGMTAAILSWTSIPGAVGYILQYHAITTPASAWINVTTQSTSITVTNLVCGTHYQWHVATYCGSAVTNISPYSPIINFTTLPCTNTGCPVPGGLTSLALNTTGSGNRMLTWNSTAALFYNIRYRVMGTDTWITTTSTTNSKLITGLQSLSHYQWQVQSVCSTAIGASSTSDWSLTAFFDTPQARTIFPNPASGPSIQLPIEIENEARMTITISDHLGRKVRSIDKTIPAGGEVLTIDIANLEGGMYFVKIKGDGKNEVQKFVINR